MDVRMQKKEYRPPFLVTCDVKAVGSLCEVSGGGTGGSWEEEED